MVLLVEKMVELLKPLAPAKVLHWTLMAKKMGYSAAITGIFSGKKPTATAARASTAGHSRRISTWNRCGSSTVDMVPAK